MTDWTQAHCRDMDVDAFFVPVDDHDAVARAKAVCVGCPVSEECLELVMWDRLAPGVFGGTTFWERRALRRRLEGYDREPRPSLVLDTA